MPSDSAPPSVKKKQPSGHQNRKKKAEKDAATKASRGHELVPGSWASQGYQDAAAQFDKNAPPSELPVYGQPPTTFVRAVNAAVLQLEQGAFYAAAYLADGMMRDDRLAAKLEERLDRITGADVEIEPAEEDEPEGEENEPQDSEPKADAAAPAGDAPKVGTKPAKPKKSPAEVAAEDFEEVRAKLAPDAQLSALMRNGLMLSVGIGQVQWLRTEEGSCPTFRVWNNRFLRWDWLVRRYRLTTENQGEITLDFANGYDYTDGAVSLSSPDAAPARWVVYEPFGPQGWLHGAKIRALATPWIIRYWVRTWWARHQEVHGQPLRLGIIPADRTPAQEATFLSQLSNLAHEAVIRLPQGAEGNQFDVKLLEASANTWEGFEKLLAHCDDSIAITLLGQSQSTKGQGGLGAQDNAGESTLTRISRKDAKIADVLRQQLIKPWAEENYGDAELAPFINFQVEPPEDESAAAKVDLAVGQALVAFKNAAAPIDIREYLEQRGYPLLTEEAHADMKKAAMEDAQAAMGDKSDSFGNDKKDNGETK